MSKLLLELYWCCLSIELSDLNDARLSNVVQRGSLIEIHITPGAACVEVDLGLKAVFSGIRYVIESWQLSWIRFEHKGLEVFHCCECCLCVIGSLLGKNGRVARFELFVYSAVRHNRTIEEVLIVVVRAFPSYFNRTWSKLIVLLGLKQVCRLRHVYD